MAVGDEIVKVFKVAPIGVKGILREAPLRRQMQQERTQVRIGAARVSGRS